jgi:hypothetical protein
VFGLVSNDRILAEFAKSLISRSINDRGVSDKVFKLIVWVDVGDLWYVFGLNEIFGLLFF